MMPRSHNTFRLPSGGLHDRKSYWVDEQLNRSDIRADHRTTRQIGTRNSPNQRLSVITRMLAVVERHGRHMALRRLRTLLG